MEITDYELENFSLSELARKYNISAYYLRKMREERNIIPLIQKDGRIATKIINNIEYKRCGACLNWFPMNKEYFYGCASKPTGFMAACKKCQDEHCDKSDSKISNWWNEEKINDIYKMCDKDFSRKWDISQRFIIAQRKVLGIKPFKNKHNTIDHIFEADVEKKKCSMCKQFVDIKLFFKKKNRKCGIGNVCKNCHRIKQQEYRKTEQYKLWYMNWKIKYKDQWRKIWKTHRLKKDKAFIYWNNVEFDKMYEIFGKFCAWCGKTEEQNLIETGNLQLDLEHYIPIAKGGLTIPGNLYPCCQNCNRGENGKFTNDARDWATQKFGNVSNILCDEIEEKLNQHYNDFINRIENILQVS